MKAHRTVSTLRPVLWVTLTMMFGLQMFRVFLPTLAWYMGASVSAEKLALFALILFACALLAPLLRIMFGEKGALFFTAGSLAVVRGVGQFFDAAEADLIFSAAGIALWSAFLPLWYQSPRNRPHPQNHKKASLPILALALPLAFLLDTGLRSLLLSYDLFWRQSWWAEQLSAAMVASALILLLFDLSRPVPPGGRSEPGFGRTIAIAGLGPFLFLALTVLHNPAALAVTAGLSDNLASLLVNVFTALAVLLSVLSVAWPQHWRTRWALLWGGLLVISMTLWIIEVRPLWLWFGIGTLSLWASAGIILSSTTRVPPIQKGLWRTSISVFLALTLMVVIVFLVSQFNMFWMPVVAGSLLMVASVWASHSPARYKPYLIEQSTLDRALRWMGGAAGLVLLAVLSFVVFNPAPTTAAGFPDRPLRVMTYNIHQGIDAGLRIDLEAIAETIANEQPDVIILNEVNRARSTNGVVDTLPLISRRLGLPYVFGPTFADHQYGNAILTRLPIREWSNTHYTHKTTEVRGLLRAVLETGAEPITFYGTHLDHIGGPNNVREEQIAEALEMIGDTPRTLLLGDLNARPDTPEIQQIYAAGYQDALVQQGLSDVFTFWDPEPIPGKRIDYIFATPDLEILSARVIESRASDHLPVLVEVNP